jgi:glycerol-3-phosphate dehydrogenase
MNRAEQLNTIINNPEWDVLVIGGGVNGIGTFRDLALQGVRVLLVEKDDFVSGASAASSHMLHGGIRYLENGEFRLVREALHERNRLLKNAPHYARPLPTTIPIFRWFSGLLNAPLKFLRLLNRPAERGALVIKIGLMFYDALTGADQTMPRHHFQMRDESLKTFPNLSPNIICTATYYDAWIASPERLCVEMLADVDAASDQAFSLNYAGVVSASAATVTFHDAVGGGRFAVKPKIVINAAGPWIDFVNGALNLPTRFIGGTKGSHIILDHPELHQATGGSEIFFENDDGRIVLIFPYLDRVMIGTTDIRIDDPEQAVCTDEEID